MNLVLGLDIGIASVGWCVLDEGRKKIAGLGVRVFPVAENPKDGAPLALPRRLARSARRRLKRRRERLDSIRGLSSAKDWPRPTKRSAASSPVSPKNRARPISCAPKAWTAD